jgi:hypothetical protein
LLVGVELNDDAANPISVTSRVPFGPEPTGWVVSPIVSSRFLLRPYKPLLPILFRTGQAFASEAFKTESFAEGSALLGGLGTRFGQADFVGERGEFFAGVARDASFFPAFGRISASRVKRLA